MSPGSIHFTHGDLEHFIQVQPLWEKLVQYHRDLGPRFEAFFRDADFKRRVESLRKKTENGSFQAWLAWDADQLVGYCAASVYGTIGEIESLYVEPPYRGAKTGHMLVSKSLEWLNSQNVKKKVVSVGVGNDKVFGFYEQFGFFPRSLTLEQI